MKELILDYLRNNASGIVNSKTSFEIVQHIKIKSGGRTNENLRQELRNMISEGYPIGSCKNGYFIMTNQSELDYVIHSLNERIKGIEKRREHLIEFNSDLPHAA